MSAIDDVLEFIGDDLPERVAIYVEEHEHDLDFIERVNKLCYETKWTFLAILLSSHYNIFTKWYKDAVIDCALNSDDNDISFVANDLLNYYKKEFDKVK